MHLSKLTINGGNRFVTIHLTFLDFLIWTQLIAIKHNYPTGFAATSIFLSE